MRIYITSKQWQPKPWRNNGKDYKNVIQVDDGGPGEIVDKGSTSFYCKYLGMTIRNKANFTICTLHSYYYHLNWGAANDHGEDNWYALSNFTDGNSNIYDYALNVTKGMRP